MTVWSGELRGDCRAGLHSEEQSGVNQPAYLLEQTNRGGTLKQLLRRGLLIVVGVSLFLLFLYRLDLSVLRVSMRTVDYTLLWTIVLLNFTVPLLKTLRWRMLLSILDMSVGKVEMFQGVSAGYFLGLVTPGTSGEVGRIFTVGVDRATGLTTVLYEKFFDFLVLFMISGCALVFHYFNRQMFVVAVVVCGGGSVLGFYVSSMTGGWSGRLVGWALRRVIPAQKRGSIETVSRSVNRLSGDFRLCLLCALYSLVLWILPGVQFYLISKALSISMNFQMTMIGFYVPYLAGVVSLLPLGLGVFDFSTKGILGSSYGLGPEVASSVALAFRLLVTLPLVVWGFIWYCYRVWRRQK